MLSAEITGILWILQEQAPHRDDIHVNLGQVRIIKWGSRGRAFYIEGTVPTSQQTWSHWVSTGAQSVNWIVATIKAERKPREKKNNSWEPPFPSKLLKKLPRRILFFKDNGQLVPGRPGASFDQHTRGRPALGCHESPRQSREHLLSCPCLWESQASSVLGVLGVPDSLEPQAGRFPSLDLSFPLHKKQRNYEVFLRD